MLNEIEWQPTATLETLRHRAKILQSIRQFFAERGVLEVETPVLSPYTITDPHVRGLPVVFQGKTLYLQTSPEYAMKRLLAAGCGSIYQITKAFREDSISKKHHPEFTMIEWYRSSFDHHDLMDEMDDLLQLILQVYPAERLTYAAIFKKYLDIDPHTISLPQLINCADQQSLVIHQADTLDVNDWLDILWTHCIEMHIGKERPIFVYDFPIFQAALAKIRFDENPPVASRFEVYFKGVELANGFHELQDAEEQEKRFQKDLTYRKQNGLPEVEIDYPFLAALTHGLPDCAGVALGIDRLIMLALNNQTIQEVLSFSLP